MEAGHVPVLLDEALEYLAVRPEGIYVDATFGAGGHSRRILEQLTSGRLIAFDVDPKALERCGDLPAERFTLVRANFRELARRLDELELSVIDGILYDLGVSSMQLDVAERGMSFREEAPLDMRLDPTTGPTAAEMLATVSESELAQVIFEYGQERAARRIARAIVRRRDEGRLPRTTTGLAALVAGVLHRYGHRERIHPATRTFQALRIAVNDELGALRESLLQATDRLATGGRIVVISFHSLEDKIVKEHFRSDRRLEALTRKPVVPTEAETSANPRARSAKLRAARRVEEEP
ncbi:MAG TPA: 16S rRNA (cytosine(1402)-N(4))-methyltransferase RsmH [Candidatus Dormibacteraeota bacterium]|nr:16S rRNA (cytosine(1402)-N(4))-methyltransferase RsmH [Candidatus Dormibacteraeota bacterium]